MRKPLVITMAAVALGGCGSATAATPDSKNPAHCVAAFGYAAHLFTKGNQRSLATKMMSRAETELQKASQAGRDREDVISESRRFAKALIGQDRPEQMDRLVLGCLKQQDAS